MAIEKELQTFERERPNLVSSSGRFALVHADEVEGTYDTYADALQVGYAKFGLEPFMVKQIELIETVHYFTRDI